ncbi:hypothetical protein D1871_18390 [Nakamurella silvestris]|nr:hypothetical protein D1871_18390 [Nakamurella silvestris]
MDLNLRDDLRHRHSRPRRWAALGITATVVTSLLGLAAPTASAGETAAETTRTAPDALVDYVNPFIGTQDEGNTYPGATVPFGMVQFSPDTGHNTGYSYTDTKIRGFSLVHLSGVGCGLGGFLPVLPTTGAVTSTDYGTYQLPFSHATEKASPGYYSVDLTASAGTVRAELGATAHTGVQRYTFPATTQANVLINPGQALSSVTSSKITIVDSTTVDTEITLRKFCQDTQPFTVHTRTTFNRPFTKAGTWVGSTVTTAGALPVSAQGTSRTGGYLQFDTTTDKVVEAQTSLSYVDPAGARANLAAETATLDQARQAAATRWEQQLSLVKVTSSDNNQLKTFYSALYRSFLAPNTGTDVDGRYKGWDAAVHQATGFTYYQNFSLWDTYRTQQQMLALLAPRESADMAYSLVLQAQQGGWAPRWGYGPVETNIMTGDPITPFLVSAWSQGLLAGHEEEAYQVLKKSADGVPPASSPFNGRAGNTTYIAGGYVPYDAGATGKPGDYDIQHGGSATLEYALADGMLSTMAKNLGHNEDAARYAARGQNYRSLWDTTTKSFRARTPDGVFVAETDPASAPGFHEGTAVQYEWLVQQDMPGLVDLLGGRAAAATRLDAFFAYDKLLVNPSDTARNVWVNGAYSYYNQDKYNPNNEPDLHAPYAYLWTGQPWKTNDVVRAALTLFTDGPTGVTGNDDLGQMSSWAVMTSLGLYPIVPGSDVWGLSTPVFTKAEITLDDTVYPSGKLTLNAPGLTASSYYTQSLALDGQPVTRAYLTGDQLTSGHSLDYTVGATPSSTWAVGNDAAPGAASPSDAVVNRISAGITPSSVSLAAGASTDVTLKVLAQVPGTVNGSITVSGPARITVGTAAPWKIVSNGLPGQQDLTLSVKVKAGTPAGAYPLTVKVGTDSGATITRQLTVVVPVDSSLKAAFNNKGIGDRGRNNANFDGGNGYLIRDLMGPAGLPAGVALKVASSGLTYVLGGATSDVADNIAAAGQTTDVSATLGTAGKISFIGAATGSNQTATVVLRYADDTTGSQSVTLTDWCSGSPAGGNVSVGKASARWYNGSIQNIGCGLFATTPITLPAGKTLKSITWPNNSSFHVFAIASDVPAPKAASVTDVTYSATEVVTGTPVTATVTVTAPAASVAGKVVVRAGDVVVGSADLQAGGQEATAEISLSDLPVGASRLKVSYSGSELVESSATGSTDLTVRFVDYAATAPFYDDVMWLAGKGITRGFDDGRFRPGTAVDRQTFAAFLYRLSNPGTTPPACTSKPYADGPVTHPLCAEITWLKAHNITKGFDDGTYLPTANIDRQAIAAFLYRLTNPGTTPPACTSKPYTDIAVTHPFCAEITWLKAQNITKGFDDGTFRGSSSTDRQTVAAFLHRLTQIGAAG